MVPLDGGGGRSEPLEIVRRTTIERDGENLERTTPTPERKLVAILSADVKDYSRLMGVDEVGTLRTLTRYGEVMAGLIEQYRGRVVNFVGDNLLAEFPSVVDAVPCAQEIQRALQKRNAQLPLHRRMEFRIGLNVGDVIVEEGQIYGDGVNIAARLEQLAEAGGICISGTVHDQIENKLTLRCDYLGEQTVKNIAQPVRVYRVQMEPEAETFRGQREPPLFFPPFHLDVVNACLWSGKKNIPLTPKDFAVLYYLATHSDRLVTHDELFKAVWPDTVVSRGVLKVCLYRIRQMLGDTTKTPQFIKNEPRRGYRFIAPLITPPPVPNPQFPIPSPQPEPAPSPQPLAPNFVGREAELQRLHGWLEKAQQGERQFVFVTGEPGIGKTTVVNAFLERVAAQGSIAIGRGQCIEHYGPGEAYLPVLEALKRLWRAPEGSRLIDWLRQHAPTWLVQMPALLNATDFEALQRKVQGATRERMLREMLEAVEVLTERRPLVLVLEDLHWSDGSTLELLAAVARRQERARLLVIGTYRPVEMLSKKHPLKEVMQELFAHHLCVELALRLLSEADVAEYLRTRFPINVLPASFARALHQRTEGNPLFLVNVVDDLVAQEVIAQGEKGWTLQGGIKVIEGQVPESIRHLIAKQSVRLLPAEQRVLQAASVAGMEFSAAAVAAALEADVAEVEEWCAGLAARQHFLRRIGISQWPDGTVAEYYGFLHALYQHLWHERVGIGRRQRLHLRIGERQEAAYGNRAGEIATELAVHFEQGRDYERAVRYLQQAAGNALQRSAYQEATNQLMKGLELLKALPDAVERARQELGLQTLLGLSAASYRGYAAPEVEQTYRRARELCQQLGNTTDLFPVVRGLCTFYIVRDDQTTARELAEQCLRLAQESQRADYLMEGHTALGYTLGYLGEFEASLKQLEHCLTLYESQRGKPLAFLTPQDSGVACLTFSAFVLWLCGYPDQALRRTQDALTLAQQLEQPFNLAYAHTYKATCHQWRREPQEAASHSRAAIQISTEHGFGVWLCASTIQLGIALGNLGQPQEGIALLVPALAAWRAGGAELMRPHFLAWLAEIYRAAGQLDKALAAIAEGLEHLEEYSERIYASVLYRLRGELMLGQSGGAQEAAAADFLRAIEIARAQQAKSLELQATMSLYKLRSKQGRGEESRAALAALYNWFTEGFETADLQEAKALLSTRPGLPGKRRYK